MKSDLTDGQNDYQGQVGTGKIFWIFSNFSINSKYLDFPVDSLIHVQHQNDMVQIMI